MHQTNTDAKHLCLIYLIVFQLVGVPNLELTVPMQ